MLDDDEPSPKPPYNKILIGVILILLVSLGLVVGTMILPSISPVHNKTFSSSGISFQYPGNWSDNATITWASSSNNTQNETIGSLGNGNVTLAVLYIPEFSSYNIQSLGSLSIAAWKTGGVNQNILSNTVSQIGQNSVDQIIYTQNDPVTGVLYKTDYVLIGGSGKAVYALVFRAPESDFAEYYSQFQSILSSVILGNQTITNSTVTHDNTVTNASNGTNNKVEESSTNTQTVVSSNSEPAPSHNCTQSGNVW